MNTFKSFFSSRAWESGGNSSKTVGGWWRRVIDLAPKILPSTQRLSSFALDASPWGTKFVFYSYFLVPVMIMDPLIWRPRMFQSWFKNSYQRRFMIMKGKYFKEWVWHRILSPKEATVGHAFIRIVLSMYFFSTAICSQFISSLCKLLSGEGASECSPFRVQYIILKRRWELNLFLKLPVRSFPSREREKKKRRKQKKMNWQKDITQPRHACCAKSYELATC